MDSGDGGESWRADREADGENGTEEHGDDTDGRNGGGAGGGGDESGADGGGSGGGGDGGDRSDGLRARVRWFMRTDEEWVLFVREVLSSLGVVVLIGLVLFAASGLWPPMVAVESGSMTPHLQKGDLVFVMEEHRFAGGAAHDGTGVVPYEAGTAAGYSEFDEPGDVIVYRPYGDNGETPIIHRARFWVNDGENWYDEANPTYLGSADDCEELVNCPAPHAGFITKGDANSAYDQVDLGGLNGPISSPVEPSWVVGTAEFRIPWLGKIRLLFGTVNAETDAAIGNTTSMTAPLTAPPAPTPTTVGGPLGNGRASMQAAG